MFQSDTRWQHAIGAGLLFGVNLSLFLRTAKGHDFDKIRIDPFGSDEILIS